MCTYVRLRTRARKGEDRTGWTRSRRESDITVPNMAIIINATREHLTAYGSEQDRVSATLVEHHTPYVIMTLHVRNEDLFQSQSRARRSRETDAR